MSWNDDLDSDQIAAASYYGTHARLIAGPGTGKTLTLIRRIIYLVEEQNIDPQKIIILTFTRSARAELEERLKEGLNNTEFLPQILTLHSFAIRMILRNPTRTRLPQPIRIADDYEERQIVVEEMKDILNLNSIKAVYDLFNKLSADWETLEIEEEGWERRFPNPQFLGTWQEHRNIYSYTLRSELVYQLKLALEEGNLEFGVPVEHLLVDEYQDLNPCDLAVIKHLTNFGPELFCAGDDDQSIYGFRYANPEGIRRFSEEYDPSASLRLETCYRCDEKILQLGLYVAEQDPRREPKTIHCREGCSQGCVRILNFTHQQEEADGIATICSWLINYKGIDPSNILILVRNDRNRIFSKVIFDAIHDKKLPVRIESSPLAPLFTDEGRTLICLLHLFINPQDNLAWRVLLDIRNNGIGSSTFKRIYEMARTQGSTFFEILRQVCTNPDIIPIRGVMIQNEFNFISDLLEQFDISSFQDLNNFILAIANEVIHDETTREEVIDLFQKVIQLDEEIDLEKALRLINLSLGNEEQETHEGCIAIMTMHQAKGLSADAVFIMAAEDEYIPGRAQGNQIDDERRLLFVSLTRAKQYLYITHCRRRIRQQIFSGRSTRTTLRNLTRFLRGGPIRSIRGRDYLRRIS